MFKRLIPLVIACGGLGTGCVFGHHHAGKAPAPVVPAVKAVKAVKAATVTVRPIVTPDASLAATVISVDNVGRFVILNFPDGRLPRLNTRLFLYRGGLKTGEVKVVGPEKDTSIVADIVTGDARDRDIVRDQ